MSSEGALSPAPRRPSSERTRDEFLWELRGALEGGHRHNSFVGGHEHVHAVGPRYQPPARDDNYRFPRHVQQVSACLHSERPSVVST